MTDKDQYVKGFNRGYALRQYRPDLAKMIDELEGSQDFLQGFKAGKNQFETELDQEIQRGIDQHEGMSTPDQTKDIPGKSPDKDQDEI
ncbi:MAG: hypothetical protein RLP14_02680 [Owenweeksia sp.]